MADTPSDDDVRKKAYALWEARGRPHGSGHEDWEKAKALLEPGEPRPERPSQPTSPMQAFTDGILGVTSAAFGAASSMMEGLLGAANPAKPAERPQAAKPAEGEPLVAAERKLQVEAEARVSRAALDAAGTREPDPT